MSYPTLYDLGGPPENIQIAQAVFAQDARGKGLIPGGMAEQDRAEPMAWQVRHVSRLVYVAKEGKGIELFENPE